MKIFILSRCKSVIVSTFTLLSVSVVYGQCSPTYSTSGGNTTVTFSPNGTCNWTVPMGVSSVIIECYGGGGGSGGVRVTHSANPSYAISGGGKGGQYARTNSVSVSAGQVLSITVGAGGTAGTGSASATPTAGGAGGNSFVTVPSLGTVTLASGGSGSLGAESTTAYNRRTAGASTHPSTGIGDVVNNGGNGGGACGVSTRGTSGSGGGGAGTTAAGSNGQSGSGANSTAIASGSCQSSSAGGGAGGATGGGTGANRVTLTGSNFLVGNTATNLWGAGAAGSVAWKTNSTNRGGPGAAGSRGAVRITYVSPPEGLPVTLSSFNANCEGNVTYITWTTASEQKSDYFTLERSRDGQNWSVVEKVIGAGTTNSTNYYAVNDNAFTEMYYRLTQTDFDGNEVIFDPIHVNCSSANNDKLVVYPNPNDGAFTVAVNATEIVGEATIFIHDVSGKVITFRDVNVLSGTNAILFENTNIDRGTYLVSIQGKSKKTFTPVKLVIQ